MDIALSRKNGRCHTIASSRGALYYFREVQHFRQTLLWLFLFCVMLLSLWEIVQQVFLGIPFGNNPAPDTVLVVIAIVFGLGFPFFFYVTNLTTEVRSDGVYLRFFPLEVSFNRIRPENIKEWEAVVYRPIREYGGWGIRYGKKTKVYNVSGNQGVMLTLANGKRLLIGSLRPDELAEAIGCAVGEGRPRILR